MSDRLRRQRQTRPASARLRSSPLVPVEAARPARIGSTELLACVAVAVVVLTLAALIWIVTIRSMQEQRAEIRDRAEQALVGQAATVAETVSHELLMIDQSLTIIQAAWKADSDSVDLDQWRRKMPALTEVADDFFICDETHIIRQDILPQAVGQGVGAAYVTFAHGALEQYDDEGNRKKESLLPQASSGTPINARQFLMYVIRPLDHPNGWLVGASYRSTELPRLFAQASLGYNPIVALVDSKRGTLLAAVGPGTRRPKTDLAKSPFFAAISKSPSGTWLGDTAIDGVERIHAFHRIADRDMVVLVAASWNEVMAPANNLAVGAQSVAFLATTLVIAIGGLVLRELFAIPVKRRQKRTLDRNRKELERLRSDATVITARSQLNMACARILMDNMSTGIAVFDPDSRLVQWNQPFLEGIGIELRQHMLVDTMLREQAAKGLFAPEAGTEEEVARRADMLRSGDPASLSQLGPDQQRLILLGLPITDDGFILILNGLAAQQTLPALLTTIGEPTAPAPIEW